MGYPRTDKKDHADPGYSRDEFCSYSSKHVTTFQGKDAGADSEPTGRRGGQHAYCLILESQFSTLFQDRTRNPLLDGWVRLFKEYA